MINLKKTIIIMLPIIDLRKKIFIEADNFLNKLNEPNLLNIDYFDIMVCSDYDTLKKHDLISGCESESFSTWGPPEIAW